MSLVASPLRSVGVPSRPPTYASLGAWASLAPRALSFAVVFVIPASSGSFGSSGQSSHASLPDSSRNAKRLATRSERANDPESDAALPAGIVGDDEIAVGGP